MTIVQFFEAVEGLLRQKSEIFTEKYPPLTLLEFRQTVRASSQMRLPGKAWYAKEKELDGEIARSTMLVHARDGHR